MVKLAMARKLPDRSTALHRIPNSIQKQNINTMKNTIRTPFVQLPRLGLGYYSYSNPLRQFGTSKTIETVKAVAGQFRYDIPDALLGIGDISFCHGGTMQPHRAHKHGREIDIRPMRTDKKHAPVTICDANYSRDLTEWLVKKLLAHSNVKSILFNDLQIQGVTSYAGHDNHLHVHMKE
jgi:hypothetical protein